jgi:hypothetical protein
MLKIGVEFKSVGMAQQHPRHRTEIHLQWNLPQRIYTQLSGSFLFFVSSLLYIFMFSR